MNKSWSGKERALQIELVRARAAIERQSLAHNINDMSQSLKPASLLHALFPRLSSKGPTDWIFQALSLTRQYPLLASSASALLSGIGKRRRLWRIAASLLLGWQVARALKSKSD